MLSDEEKNNLLTKVYRDILQREPDKIGFEFWLKKIESDNLDYATLAKLFMESDEYKMKEQNERLAKLKNSLENESIDIKSIPVSRLDALCNPPGYNDLRGITSKFYHKFSIYITKLFLLYHIPAHFATICGISFAIIGALFVTTLNIHWMILGIIFLELHFMFDLSDGEIARFYQKDSAQGTYFDILSHMITNPIIWVSLMISHYMIDQNFLVIIAGALLIIASTVVFGTSVLRRAIITIAIFSGQKTYAKKLDPKDIFVYENLKLEKLQRILLKYLVAALPGNTHVSSLYVLGLVIGIVFPPSLPFLMVIVLIYGILWNFTWILETYLILRKKDFDRFLNRINY